MALTKKKNREEREPNHDKTNCSTSALVGIDNGVWLKCVISWILGFPCLLSFDKEEESRGEEWVYDLEKYVALIFVLGLF